MIGKPLVRIGIVLGVLLILGAYSLYPVSFSPATLAVARGGDVHLNTWILCWEAHQLLKNPLDLYNGNIFFPERNTLALSDNMLISSIIALPVFVASYNPVLTYNFVLFVSILLAGIGTYLLVYRLTGNFYAALVAAILYDFSATRMARITQIQLFTAHWTPFALLYLHKFLEKRSFKNLFLLALFFTFQALSGAYNTVYLATAIGIGIFYYGIVDRGYKQIDFFWKLALLGIVTSLFVFPFFFPYLQNAQEYGMVRSARTVARFSPDLHSYFAIATPFYLWLTGFFGPLKSYLFSQPPHLFPGMIPVLLTLYGLWKGKINRHQGFYILLGLFALIASTGSKLRLYNFLYEWILIFKMTRVPSRFMLLAVLSLSVLSGFGMVALLEQYRRIPRRRYLVFATLAPAFFLIESARGPIRADHESTHPPQVYRWLNTRGEDQIITELPMSNTLDAGYMFNSVFHWRRLTNGYSGYSPPYYRALRRMMADFPNGSCLRRLSETSDYVIVHANRYPPQEWKQLSKQVTQFQKYLEPVVQLDQDYVYRLRIDLKDTCFKRYYPQSALRKNRLSFQIRSVATNSKMADYVTVLVNDRPIQDFPLNKAMEIQVLSVPSKFLRRGPNEVKFLYGYRRLEDEASRDSYRIGSTGVASPVDLVVVSSGKKKRSRASIVVNGRDYAPGKPGCNVVVVDPGSGEVEGVEAFDTSTSEDASAQLAEFVRKIPTGKIVVVTVKEHAAHQLTPEAIHALENIGSEKSLIGKRRWSQVIIGVKGAQPGEAIEEISAKMVRKRLGRELKDTGFRMKDLELIGSN